MKIKRYIPVVLVIWLLSSCAQGANPIPTPTPTLETLPTAKVVLQTLEIPTTTPTATQTATVTETATLTLVPSLTFTSTPEALFSKAQVTSVTTPDGIPHVAIKVPGLKTSYNIILDSKKFKCQTDAKAPEVLFCIGDALPAIAQNIPLIFVNPADETEVYSGTTFIIKQAVPTSTPAGYGNCPNRGKNTSCEIECRLYSGNPCLVVSCFDDCGLYYSLDNCPQGQNEGICSEELRNQLLTQYGIPIPK
jgi:hypothetical protein